MNKGLKKFGFELVERMNELGIIIDVSYISDQGTIDVLSTSQKPIAASHSNSRLITNHQRNLPDQVI